VTVKGDMACGLELVNTTLASLPFFLSVMPFLSDVLDDGDVNFW